MIVVRLLGGLGNQMFQYAAGRALAERTGGELLFDVADFDALPDRAYALGPYPVRGRVADAGELAAFPPRTAGRLARWARRAVRVLRPGPQRFVEPHSHYTPAFERLRGDVYLDGYWQSERYFAPVADAVRTELTLPGPLPDPARAAADAIRASEAVSVHVRRGDYVTNPTFAATHGALEPAYHRKAAARVAEGLAEPAFFVFSDEPDWVRAHLDLGAPFTVVEGGSPQADLHLMSLCRRHAVANSSFSWWGAWLCAHPDKRVVAPRRWFGPARAGRGTSDLLPVGWERV